jgi:hypothetical protein
LDKMLVDPKEGDFWQVSEKGVMAARSNVVLPPAAALYHPNAQADHIRPVKEGGANATHQQRASCPASRRLQAAKQTSQTSAPCAHRVTSCRPKL